MKRANQITVLGIALAMAVFVPCSWGQKPQQHAENKGNNKPANPPSEQAPRHADRANSPAAGSYRGPGIHGGDWLRQHQNLPPQEQERVLHNDPNFQRLPPERQQRLEQRLRNFNSLPPDKRERVLNRMETFEHLPPQEQQRVRTMYSQMQALPDERRQAVRQAAHRLRNMPPDARERVLNSPEFRNRFSDHEQNLVRNLSSLNGPTEENGPAVQPH